MKKNNVSADYKNIFTIFAAVLIEKRNIYDHWS